MFSQLSHDYLFQEEPFVVIFGCSVCFHLFLDLMFINVLPACVLCTICVPGAHGGLKRALNSLEPKLKVVGHQRGARNQFRSPARAASAVNC